MKKLYALLMVLALASVGCGKKNDETTAVNSGGGRDARATDSPMPNTSYGNMSLVGRVKDQSADSFQDNARGLVNGSIPEEYLGFVSNGYTGDQRTGIFFGGQVGFSSGGQSGMAGNGQGGMSAGGQGGGYQDIHPDSQLIISVVDDFAARNQAQPVGIHMTQAQGYVQGNYAEIQFADNIGVILLKGHFDNQNFSGQLQYSNDYLYDGTPGGGEGSFAEFRIPTCSFFKCN